MIDHKTFSQVLRSFERKNKGWIDWSIGHSVIVMIDGVEIEPVIRVNRKRKVAEVAITDANGDYLFDRDGAYFTKYIHGKIKLIQMAGK